MPDGRLDAELAARGLARSRTHAARLIADGLVTVDGSPVVKPSQRVRDGAVLEVAASDGFVSRAAYKLVAALDGFGVAVEGVHALDVGASTGGFTQVLLERGAASVVALDVGHGQLHPSIATDSRVTVVEGFNVRDLTPEALASLSGRVEPPSLIVGDLSFISLTLVLPPLARSAHDADVVLLVKPQFEVGRQGVREGIVKDAALRADALSGVLWAAWDLGWRTAGILPSPIPGTHGNSEFLVRLGASRGSDPSEWSGRIAELA